ncbi:hypothetical protein XHV734_2668 [Xanthomonas hortorum pv. vitians]|nr:hypothetical protein XHV734_2668 [Xanthomonas hortorum pv. vitians]
MLRLLSKRCDNKKAALSKERGFDVTGLQPADECV